MQPQVRIFRKFFSRDIPLFIIEYWHKGEYEVLRNILEGATHFNPLFIKKDGVVNVYYDINNDETAVKPLIDFVIKNPDTFMKIADTYEKSHEEFIQIIKTIDKQNVQKVFDLMLQVCGLMPVLVQVGEMQDGIDEKIVERARNLRTKTQEDGIFAQTFFNKIFTKYYHEYTSFIDVVSANEIISGSIPDIDILKKRQKEFIFFEGNIIVDKTQEQFEKEFQVKINEDLAMIGEYQKNIPMKMYKKIYTRENCLIAIEIWEEHQRHRLNEKVGGVVPISIFDAYLGVVGVYYEENIWDVWAGLIANKANNDQEFIPQTMKWYGENLDILEKIWHEEKLSSREELLDLFELGCWSWVGLSISYNLPDMKNVSEVEQNLGMELRKRSVDFLENTDHVIQNTLHDLFPHLGDLVKYISIEEIRSGNIPSEEILKEREKHYIYFDFKILTNKDLYELARENGIEIQEEKIEEDAVRELKGQIAMKGKVEGRVRILHNKSEIPNLQSGEILVTAMTTPDYLPAMQKAAAFITDEGGITCHAAIVAREIGKPCIIGTKIATKVLKDGDMVEVDANTGIVRIINK